MTVYDRVIWWFYCQKYRVYTVCIWFWPTLTIHSCNALSLIARNWFFWMVQTGSLELVVCRQPA